MVNNKIVPKPFTGRKTQTLAKSIFQADVPESVVQSLPAQALYMAIKHNGLASSIDVVEMASVDQCRLLLDLDLWSRDSLNEDNFWEWLALPDEANDLTILQKMLKCVDLKVIALMISRCVEVETFDEPTDQPPSPRHYTPDKGSTWIRINIDDEDRHFMFARLLALIFETSAELFYQILSVPGVSTDASLEEESFQDKRRRLEAEGIPDPELASEVNSPLPIDQAVAAVHNGGKLPPVHDVSVVEPFCYESSGIEPLGSFLSGISPREDVEASLTLISNAAIVHFGVDFYDQAAVIELLASVKGAMNIGLEMLLEAGLKDYEATYSSLGVRGIYRVGLGKLLSLRRLAQKTRNGLPDDSEPHIIAMLEALSISFPKSPMFLTSEGTIEEHEGKLAPGLKPIESLSFCKKLELLVDKAKAA